jgi:hypothetical protein
MTSVIFRAAYFAKRWRGLEIALCLLVFLFAFHAKTSMYGGGSRPEITPSTSAKLWLNGQKLEVEPNLQPVTVLFWFAILFLHSPGVLREPVVQRRTSVPSARHLGLQDLHRSLRPPPLH